MSHQDKQMFYQHLDRAIDLFNEGQYKAALKIGMQILHLSDDKHDISAVMKHIGECYYFLHQMDKSLEYLEKAVSAWPELEDASVRLFLQLTEMRREKDALEEMKRFLLLADSEFYEKYLLGHIKALGLATGQEEETVEDLKTEIREGDFEGFELLTGHILKAVSKSQ